MNNNELPNTIDIYIQKIDKLLPYPRSAKKAILESLYLDIEEAMNDANSPDPVAVFGDPYSVAKTISKSDDWKLSPVSFKIRTVAYLIDFCFSLLLCIIAILPVFIFIGPSIVYESNTFLFVIELIILFLSVMSGIFIFFCYPMLLEGFFSTTIGKKLFGLMVVDESGIKITWKQSIVRNLPKTQAEFLFFDVLIGKYLLDTKNQRALDKLAETYVVKSRN